MSVGVYDLRGLTTPLANPTPVGPMVTGGDIEDTVLATLQDWLPAYLCEWERQHGITEGTTPTPRGWAITGRDLQKLLSDQLPCVVVMAGGITQVPRREGGSGVYTAIWVLDVGVIVNAAYGRNARRISQGYARAVHLTLVQRPMTALGQPLQVDFRGEIPNELDFADSRSYSAATASFQVVCRETAWANGGPPPTATVPTDPTVPFDPWVQVTETDTTVTNTPPPDPIPT